MTAAPVLFCGERLLLDPAGALVWPDAGVLVVADLHLEKGSACARQGYLVPPWDTRITLDRLSRVMHRWRPGTVVALGDSFHDDDGFARLSRPDAARLLALTQACRFVWVFGNHDKAPQTGVGGSIAAAWEHAGLVFRHEARPGANGEICGHHHPKASVATRAGHVTRPCFVADPRRLMLPAFGAYTGGLDVRHPAIAALFARGGRAFLLGRDRLFCFGLGQIEAAERRSSPV